MDLELKGRRALVIGGSKGIGRAVARQLLREGAIVAIAARDKTALDKTVADLGHETGGKIVGATVDTSDDASVIKLVETVTAALGGIDILVNSAARPAGHAPPPKLADTTTALFLEEMNTKVMGAIRCIRAVSPQMIKSGWGRIINIGGLAARQTGSAIGSMRNVSVAAMTKNFAEELGPHGINVTAVHPGLTRTERTADTVEKRAVESGKSVAEIEQSMSARTLIGRIVESDEVATVVTFLASPKSVAITGDAIAVGGGVKDSIYD